MPRIQPIGIDLGTTYSVIAALDPGGRTRIVANAEGESLTPSVVIFEDQQTLVGKSARKLGTSKVDRLAECVKRDMGAAVYSRPIRGEFLPPEVIQACILRQLKQDAVRALGPEVAAVITVPAYFDEPRRKATSDAGEMAGWNVLDIVNEPTAAALAFGEDLGYLTPQGDPRAPLTVLVYDLGGGTFDVTIIQLQPGDLRTLATDGDVQLGGRDWDLRLAGYAADAFASEHGSNPRANPVSWQRLLGEIDEAKRTLSVRHQTSVRVEHEGQTTHVPVTRALFAELTADLLERTAHTTRQVLKDAGLEWSQIDRVLLVGGSSRMPMVAEMIERLSGQRPERSVNPDEAVARGAAIYAGYLLAERGLAERPATFRVTNVNAHSLGIEGVDPRTGRRQNAILIPRNSPLPVRRMREFVTRTVNQNSIVLRVLEGESSQPEDCTAIGRTVIAGLPKPLPQGWPIRVTYEYGTNGRLSVRGQVPGTDREATLEIERERGLTPELLGQWGSAVAADAGLDPFEALIAAALQDQPAAETQPLELLPAQDATTDDVNPARGGDREPLSEPEQANGRRLPADAIADGGGEPHASSFPDSHPGIQLERAPRKRGTGTLAYLTGHLLFSALGLVVGYYLLCWLAPDANFLHLRLPGLHP